MKTNVFSRRFAISGLLVLVATGCKPNATESQGVAGKSNGPVVSDVPLRIAMVASVENMDAIQRTWLAQSSQPIEISVLTTESLIDQKDLQSDVLVYPARLLGELVHRGWINRLPQALVEEKTGVKDSAAMQCRVGEKDYAITLGCSIPAFLSSDHLVGADDETLRWAELFSELPQVEQIAIKPGSVDSDALVDRYLAIVATLAKRNPKYGTLFDLKSLRPLLDQPEFVAAAELLVKLAKQTDDGALAVASHDAVWRQVTQAESPLFSIVAPLSLSAESKRLSGGKLLSQPPLSDLDPSSPGDTRQCNLGAGLVVSISSSCRQSSQARAFATWLGGAETRNALAAHLPGVDVSSPVFGVESTSWRAQSQGRKVADSPNVPLEPRLPGADAYRKALAQQLIRILQGEATRGEALAEAVEKWEAISDEYENQQFVYERTLGLVF